MNLTILNASREDTGVYTCSANNSIGGDNKIISITIQCKVVHIIKHIISVHEYAYFQYCNYIHDLITAALRLHNVRILCC